MQEFMVPCMLLSVAARVLLCAREFSLFWLADTAFVLLLLQGFVSVYASSLVKVGCSNVRSFKHAYP